MEEMSIQHPNTYKQTNKHKKRKIPFHISIRIENLIQFLRCCSQRAFHILYLYVLSVCWQKCINVPLKNIHKRKMCQYVPFLPFAKHHRESFEGKRVIEREKGSRSEKGSSSKIQFDGNEIN